MQARAEGDGPETVGQAVRRVTRGLRETGIAEADIEARRFCEAVTGHTPSTLFLHAEDALSGQQSERLDALMAERCSGKPVGRILGVREFYGLPLQLRPETLEPRPDTEVLVDAILAELPIGGSKDGVVLDLGCGTGAIGLAILSQRPDLHCVAVDLAPEAAACAEANADRLGLGTRFAAMAGSWGEALSGSFDAIISNPPYVSAGELADLPTEVRAHDPMLALDGGSDGLDAYRAIISDLDRLLAPDGVVALETGWTQHDQISRLANAAGFDVARRIRDLAGRDRGLVLRRKSSAAASQQRAVE